MAVQSAKHNVMKIENLIIDKFYLWMANGNIAQTFNETSFHLSTHTSSNLISQFNFCL